MTGLGPWPLLLVAVGGALGSVLRHLVSMQAAAHLGAGFPWGTLAVNVSGSAAIGLLGGFGVGGDRRVLLVTGLLGGFTTFSAFSLETGLLWERGGWWPAAAYVAASLLLGLLAFALCLWAGRRLWP